MTRSPNPRSVAVAVLEDVDRKGAYADAALDARLRRLPGMPGRDRALAAHLAYGVLRWRNVIDAHLARASERPLARLHPVLLQVLRVGAYQILFLDRVPARAAVNEAVEEARRRRLGHATGFVNAVLRAVARRAGEPLPTPSSPAGPLALRFGCPEWIVERWLAEWGEAGARLARAASRVPETFLRARGDRDGILERLRRGGVEAEPAAFAPQGIWVRFQGAPRELAPVREGAAVVQDQGSQLVVEMLAPQSGWRVIDACAAPGLKALQIGERVGGGGRVVCLDLHPHRARGLSALARDMGAANLRTLAADARRPPLRGGFDAALVDAPCSGLGVLSRTPEAKWRRSPADIEGLPELQAAILGAAAEGVRPGGVVVYATCTTLRAENEAVVEAFLAARPEFRLEPPCVGDAPWARFLTPEGFLRTFPEGLAGEGREAVDGFFAARFRRAGGTV